MVRAMRLLRPIGLLFHEDLDRVADEARRSALPTHLHPVGIEGAQLWAAWRSPLRFEIPTLNGVRFLASSFAGRRRTNFVAELVIAAEMGEDDPVAVFGNSLEAHRSVVTALACFAGDPESYEAVIARAIRVGNDTDTIAAIAGPISGAHLGIGQISERSTLRLENGAKGRVYIQKLAENLYDLSERRVGVT